MPAGISNIAGVPILSQPMAMAPRPLQLIRPAAAVWPPVSQPQVTYQGIVVR